MKNSIPNWLWLVCFLMYPVPCFSTCIVIFKKGGSIYIGADSKSTNVTFDITANKVFNKTTTDYCKIKKGGKFYFSTAGHDTGLINNWALSQSIKSKSFAELVSNFKNTIAYQLEQHIEPLRRAQREQYIKTYAKKIIGSTVLFCFENGQPQMTVFDIVLANTPDQPVQVSVQPGTPNNLPILGASDHVRTNGMYYIRQINQEKNIDINIKAIINMEAKFHPDEIGGPIDLLQLTAAGERWITRKPNCH